MLYRSITKIIFALALVFAVSTPASSEEKPIRLQARRIELHYIEKGSGDPVILLHGGQGDYRMWTPQMEALSQRYRVISYSRRYHYPNNNPLIVSDHSPNIEAEDLAVLIEELKLGRVHLVGTSIGAFAALTFAVNHPEQVRSLTLAEPPIHSWMKGSATGAEAYVDFMTRIQDPAANAFKANDEKGAMRILVDGFAGKNDFDKLPPDRVATIMQNSRAMKALILSSDPYPNLRKDKVSQLKMPMLIITGENTIKIHKLIDDELSHVCPKAQQVTIPNAGHGSPRENPEAFNAAVLKFLSAMKEH